MCLHGPHLGKSVYTINNSTCSSTNNDVNQLDSDSLVNTDSILNSESLHDVHDQIHIVNSDATKYNDSLILDQHDPDSGNNNDTFSKLKSCKMKDDKGFMISYLNINSLTQTFDELKFVMNDDLEDMISIGDSKLDDCITDAVIHVQNFKTYHYDVKRRAHGLITYIRARIIHTRRTDIEIYKSDSQYVVIEVWLRKEKWFIVSVYKPPPTNVNVFISELSQMCD